MSAVGNPLPFEIEREVAALRDIRRRSTQQGPGSIPLDPDLPPNGMISASAGGYWDNYGANQTTSPTSSTPDGLRSTIESAPDAASGDVDDPSHLFWVPAHLHPELAPAEFRSFLKEHTRSNPDGTVGPLSRSFSGSSASGLGRKTSMLSKQYKPSINDHVEDEKVVTVKRNRSSIYSNAGPALTISDLQRLEELAEEAAKSDDPSKLRSILRRSLSMNVAPSFIDQMDDIPDLDDADAPIIVPRPGQILRRSARTKIRKPGLPGDGGGHRFASTRRSGRNKAEGDTLSDNGHATPPYDGLPAAIRISEENDRPSSYSEEAFILDAYGERRDSMTSTRSSNEDDDLLSAQSHSTLTTTAPTSTSHGGPGYSPKSPPQGTVDELGMSPPRGATVRRVSPPPGAAKTENANLTHLHIPQGPLGRSPSPTSLDSPRPTMPGSAPHIHSPKPQPPSGSHQPQQISPSVSPAPSTRSNKSNKEKEKKGLLKGMWGGDKKKEKAEVARENKEREGKEKDSGFFGSLFGKKKHEEEHGGRSLTSGDGRATAAALLGASKTKQSREPSPGPGTGGNPWARYPIHVERAVYRLSHIKLANPRRPLYEQVLISNLMFWYLGVINKVTPPAPAANASANGSASSTGPSQGNANGEAVEGEVHRAVSPTDEEKERLERERIEKERAEREAKERAEKERQEAESKDRERQVEKESRKRGTLVKSPPPGSTGRRAEMPVRGPQYDVQHQMMEQERGPGGFNGPVGHGPRPMRPNAPGGGGPPPEHYRRGGEPLHDPRGPQQHGRPPPPIQPNSYGQQQAPHQDQQPPSQYRQQPPYGQPHQSHHPPPPNQGPPAGYSNFAPPLPPGAMAPPPMASDQWLGSATSRDTPYNVPSSVNLVPGQNYTQRGRSKSPPLPLTKGYPNGPVPPVNGPNGTQPPHPPRQGPRSMSVGSPGPSPGLGPGGPPGLGPGGPPGPGRPLAQRGQVPPPPPQANINGGWPTPQQRRGQSPNPPMERTRQNSAPTGPVDEPPLSYQQQPSYARERSAPIQR